MSGSERDPDSGSGAPEPQAGVLGNLPKKRPAVRSPRRPGAKAKVEAQASPPPRTAAEPQPPPAPDAGDAGAGPEHSTAADLEGIARGGIAIAGGAASLGLRIAGRAAAALRDAVERR